MSCGTARGFSGNLRLRTWTPEPRAPSYILSMSVGSCFIALYLESWPRAEGYQWRTQGYRPWFNTAALYHPDGPAQDIACSVRSPE